MSRVDGADLDGWIALTGILMKEGQFEKALAFLREAFVHHSEEAAIKIKMAVCHLKLKDKELGKKFMEEALSSNSSLESEFGYYYPEGIRDAEIENIIQQFKK